MPRKQAADISLTTPLHGVKGFTPTRLAGLKALGVASVGQLVAYLPMRHEFQEAEATIDQLVPGTVVTARGEVTATRVTQGSRARFQAVLLDETGRLDLVWFNATYLRHKVHPGMRLRVHGKLGRFGPGVQISNPKFEVLSPEGGPGGGGTGGTGTGGAGGPGDGSEPALRDARLRPVYPASEAMNSRAIDACVGLVLPAALPLIDDHLSPAFRGERALPPLADAYKMMHAPETADEANAARRRLAYDELLLLQLGVFMKRARLREGMRAPALRWTDEIDRHVRARFPFTLTEAQDGAVREVAADLSRSVPTNRLIQGDVGSGKTVVALYGMLMAVTAGHQAAMMAPTELLAEQHHGSISRMLDGSKVRVELLTGTMPARERGSVLARLAAGGVDILIGTHALLSEGVHFASLAVAVIDEQHRFGVHQRAVLRGKGSVGERGAESSELGARTEADAPPAAPAQALSFQPPAPQPHPPLPLHPEPPTTPHVLVMTATPIPRTMALTLFGDLDISTIRGLPPGRSPVATRVVGPELEGEVFKYVRERIDDGDQAYIVVPAIDTGDEGMQDLRTLHARLEAHELAGKRIAALHGRLKRDTREHVMARFRAGLIDALVATTVIEVGVDVPNATVMVVEHADRFGLAQLHQLRGRVGRGGKRSVCVLIGPPEGLGTPDAEARLAVMAATADGFVLAEKDLEIRGPGEVFGTRQAGVPPFKVADLLRDRELLTLARRDAEAWIARSPDLAAPDEALLRRRLMKQHGKWMALGDVG